MRITEKDLRAMYARFLRNIKGEDGPGEEISALLAHGYLRQQKYGNHIVATAKGFQAQQREYQRTAHA